VRRLLLLTLTFVVTSIPAGAQTGSCGCARGAPAPCAGYWDSVAVFVGRVDSVKRTTGGRTIRFTILEGFRGVGSSTVDVITGPAGQPCALTFRVGREYLVYAARAGGAADALTTSVCTRTREVEDAAADVSYARAVKDGTAPAGKITGQVLLAGRDLNGRLTRRRSPLPQIGVRIAKDGSDESVVTNEAGDFVVAHRGAGVYTVSLDVPDRYYLETPPLPVTIRDPGSCAEVEAVLSDDGRVAGRIVDSAGRPIPGLSLELSTPTLAQTRKAITGRDGFYELRRVPAGRFLLSVSADRQGARPARQARVFYPGVDKLSSAESLIVRPGERVALGDFRIPPSLKYVALSGFVLDADGRPAEGARVYLKGLPEDAPIVYGPVEVDFLGRFVVSALSGTECRLFAERARDHRVDSTEQLQVTLVDGMKPQRLVLRRRY
jgi:hypothetical protein